MEKWRAFRNSPRYEDAKGGVVKKGKNLLMTILQIILIVGISYVILSPVIGIVAQSFSRLKARWSATRRSSRRWTISARSATRWFTPSR